MAVRELGPISMPLPVEAGRTPLSRFLKGERVEVPGGIFYSYTDRIEGGQRFIDRFFKPTKGPEIPITLEIMAGLIG